MQVKDKPKRNVKRSYRAISLANELINRVSKGEKVNMQELQIKHGYSVKSARSMKVQETKSFQDAIIPIVDKMKFVHDKAITNLMERNFKKERMDSVINAAKQMVHDTQLLQGKSTENVATNVVVYGSDDFLATQMKDS